MSDTTQAAHVLGKLLQRFGEDRVLWGTDSIWYGSPQDQIQAFRAFQISPEFQDTYGYPELTDTVKRKVFGQNAAALYGVDPVPEKCAPRPETRGKIAESITQYASPSAPTTCGRRARNFGSRYLSENASVPSVT